MTRRGIRLLLGLALALAPYAARAGAPKAELWERWTAHDPASTATIDHSVWNRFLSKYVQPGEDGVNRVPYGAITAADRRALEGYIERMAALPISTYNRNEQFAYWINLYNALTVKVVLDHYPVSSILKIMISPGLFSVGPWGKKLIEVEGEDLSLDDIEHRILRPIWRDARIHYAVNCASIGCPNLQNVAFTGTNVDRLLTRAAKEYVNNARGAEVRDGRLYVSSLYEWYREDFGDSDTGVIEHLRAYAYPRLSGAIDGITRISGDGYDWELNDGKEIAAAGRGARRESGTK